MPIEMMSAATGRNSTVSFSSFPRISINRILTDLRFFIGRRSVSYFMTHLNLITRNAADYGGYTLLPGGSSYKLTDEIVVFDSYGVLVYGSDPLL